MSIDPNTQSVREQMLTALAQRSRWFEAQQAAVSSWDGSGTVEIDGDEYDDPTDAFYELPLAVDVVTVVRIQLSTGGPGEWIDAEVHDGEVQNATFHYAWSGHDEQQLSETADAALWDAVQSYVDGVMS